MTPFRPASSLARGVIFAHRAHADGLPELPNWTLGRVLTYERGSVTDVDAWAAFRTKGFARLLLSRLFGTAGYQMQGVAVGWQVYSMTHSPFHLGLIGLVQFLPLFLLTPIAGQVADRFDRAKILMGCYGLAIVMSSGLVWVSTHPHPSVWWIFPFMAVMGVVRAFAGPSAQPLLASLVPRDHYSNAVAWASSSFHVAVIAGPVIGGFVYGLGPAWVHATACLGQGIALIGISHLRGVSTPKGSLDLSLRGVAEGFRFVWRDKVILGAISLDLVAVLLGGAVALLPAICADVIHGTARELGFLRAAPAVGAVMMGTLLTRFPIVKGGGKALFGSVAIFGVATIVFGLSPWFPLSLAALAALGGADMVSVIARQPIVQLRAPDEMRGRVSAVNLLFISASNELGEFESGMTAALIGTQPAVIAGGVLVLFVAGIWWKLFPELRHLERFDAPHS